jgi:hypothetical protein
LNRGVVTSCDISKDEQLLFIPQSSLLTKQNSLKNPIAAAVHEHEEKQGKTFDDGKGLKDHVYIVIAILEEGLKGQDS